ncbi:MAG: hypothetical protein K1Y02_24190, partial [Candidatus Hydrogenedentes bacterium]|nr:hypothetical protein [Candidatus Hydrogenedentota bacterium]
VSRPRMVKPRALARNPAAACADPLSATVIGGAYGMPGCAKKEGNWKIAWVRRSGAGRGQSVRLESGVGTTARSCGSGRLVRLESFVGRS